MTVFICAVPLITAPVEVGFGILIVCTGIPVYIIFVKWKPKALTDWGGKICSVLYQVCVRLVLHAILMPYKSLNCGKKDPYQLMKTKL